MIDHRYLNDRELVLGLEALFQEALAEIAEHDLLECAVHVASEVQVEPVDTFLIEGLYRGSRQLKQYFRYIRALQACPASIEHDVLSSRAYQKLYDVCNSPIFGSARDDASLLPRRRDALDLAMEQVPVEEWSVARLTSVAARVARSTGDISLVGLGAYLGDPVVMTVGRESAVLETDGMSLWGARETWFHWRVTDHMADMAHQFVHAFNRLGSRRLPEPSPENVTEYWHSFATNRISGRCARLATRRSEPTEHYHWAVFGPDSPKSYEDLQIEEFWSERLWTTSYYSGHQVRPQHPERIWRRGDA